ncbi:MAG: DUF1122 domain-containing protein [Dehalococcoidia bacterium]|nr:DUF1122 domain-containing protein [Dehalococcoidia bacterium]
MTASTLPTDSRWRRAAEEPAHPLARLAGAEVGEDVRLEVHLGPRNHVGSTYFRVYLVTETFGAVVEPLIFGLQNSGPYPGYNWLEVIEWRDVLPLSDGRTVEVPAGIERQVFRRLGELVPAGGHLMVEYDSPGRVITAKALYLKVPPAATPLGALLAAAGCGDAFRDWYISEGGREGPRKLQGFKAMNAEHARTRGIEAIASLEAFLERDDDIDWDVLAQCRPIAQKALGDLQVRYLGATRL